MVDTWVLEAHIVRCAGSSPVPGTIKNKPAPAGFFMVGSGLEAKGPYPLTIRPAGGLATGRQRRRRCRGTEGGPRKEGARMRPTGVAKSCPGHHEVSGRRFENPSLSSRQQEIWGRKFLGTRTASTRPAQINAGRIRSPIPSSLDRHAILDQKTES